MTKAKAKRPTKAQRDNRRDVTHGLDLLNQIETVDRMAQTPLVAELRQLLQDIDARTGRRDPSKR